MADRSWNIPNRVDTRYNLASVTKMFTAVAVAQLAEQGKLSYDDHVGDLLPDYPNTDVARSVTVAELLSHTSGLIGGRALVEKAPEPLEARNLEPWLATFADAPLTARPGQRFDYSNAGYILLGAVIEKVSGQTYYDYVRDHVFKPAGMKDTDFYDLDRDPAKIARGYMDGPDGTRLDNIRALSVIGAPHAGAYSTGPDMVRFSEALTRHVLLSEASLKRMWRGVTEDPGTHREYGFGASIDSYNGHTIVSHGGGWKGITNQFDIYPDLGYTVVILTNIDDDPTAIAYKLREWLTQGPANFAPMAEAPPSFNIKTSIKGAETAGAPLAIGIEVTNRGGTSHAGIVDMEILDAKGNKINQQVTEGQKLETGERRLYTYSWTPPASGRYDVQVGLFGPGWTPKYRFDPSATINVR
jgi:CubicO group peptidase (beta-lactamase class C family)